jgi:hypothetical protein
VSKSWKFGMCCQRLGADAVDVFYCAMTIKMFPGIGRRLGLPRRSRNDRLGRAQCWRPCIGQSPKTVSNCSHWQNFQKIRQETLVECVRHSRAIRPLPTQIIKRGLVSKKSAGQRETLAAILSLPLMSANLRSSCYLVVARRQLSLICATDAGLRHHGHSSNGKASPRR